MTTGKQINITLTPEQLKRVKANKGKKRITWVALAKELNVSLCVIHNNRQMLGMRDRKLKAKVAPVVKGNFHWDLFTDNDLMFYKDRV